MTKKEKRQAEQWCRERLAEVLDQYDEDEGFDWDEVVSVAVESVLREWEEDNGDLSEEDWRWLFSRLEEQA